MKYLSQVYIKWYFIKTVTTQSIKSQRSMIVHFNCNITILAMIYVEYFFFASGNVMSHLYHHGSFHCYACRLQADCVTYITEGMTLHVHGLLSNKDYSITAHLMVLIKFKVTWSRTQHFKICDRGLCQFWLIVYNIIFIRHEWYHK